MFLFLYIKILSKKKKKQVKCILETQTVIYNFSESVFILSPPVRLVARAGDDGANEVCSSRGGHK